VVFINHHLNHRAVRAAKDATRRFRYDWIMRENPHLDVSIGASWNALHKPGSSDGCEHFSMSHPDFHGHQTLFNSIMSRARDTRDQNYHNDYANRRNDE